MNRRSTALIHNYVVAGLQDVCVNPLNQQVKGAWEGGGSPDSLAARTTNSKILSWEVRPQRLH